jgi:excisionase family DNA binding protein
MKEKITEFVLGRRAFTTKEVAEQLGITGNQVRHLIRRGLLRARSTGKAYVVPVQALDEYLAGADRPIKHRDS